MFHRQRRSVLQDTHFTLQFNHDYSSEWVGGANEYLWGEAAMVRIMRVLLWRHRWWCPRGVGHANVIITEQWRITCNRRGDVSAHAWVSACETRETKRKWVRVTRLVHTLHLMCGNLVEGGGGGVLDMCWSGVCLCTYWSFWECVARRATGSEGWTDWAGMWRPGTATEWVVCLPAADSLVSDVFLAVSNERKTQQNNHQNS